MHLVESGLLVDLINRQKGGCTLIPTRLRTTWAESALSESNTMQEMEAMTRRHDTTHDRASQCASRTRTDAGTEDFPGHGGTFWGSQWDLHGPTAGELPQVATYWTARTGYRVVMEKGSFLQAFGPTATTCFGVIARYAFFNRRPPQVLVAWNHST